MALFEEQGLRLPALEVPCHSSKLGCKNNLGLFRSTTRPWRVDICSDKGWVLPNELAHARVAANADADRQAAFVAQQGLPTWGDDSFSWHHRGVERADDTIQQNLALAQVTDDRLAHREPMMAALKVITGQPSPLR